MKGCHSGRLGTRVPGLPPTPLATPYQLDLLTGQTDRDGPQRREPVAAVLLLLGS